MACDYDDGFCQNKFLLEPREAGFHDLLFLLFSSDIGKRRFIESIEEHKQTDFKGRWLIFISVIMQKVFLYGKKPMDQLGNMLELWLNLPSSNGGFFKLLLNLLKGNVVKPERSSAIFTSVLANMDTRVELNRNIRPGDRKYKAFLSLMAAKLSYENEAFIKSTVKDHWEMEFLGFYDFWNDYLQRSSTHAFMFRDTKTDPNLVVVAFRGTRPFDADDWLADVDLSWYELQGVGKIHRGFMKALGLQRNGWPNQPDNDHRQYAYYLLRDMLKAIVKKNEKAKFVITGHSLGAALAILFVGVLALQEEELLLDRLEGVYTFGQPRVGDRQFGKFMLDKLRQHNVKYLRYVYCNDIVPRLPYDDATLMYKHFGPCLYFNSCYKGQVLWEEPNKNYFSLLWMLPKNINAIWELIRSFIIPFTEGRDYKESWLLRGLRIVGLVIPGLSAHSPQDYDNCTRLGTLPLSLHQPEDSWDELHQD
ncbi:hypothetical protein K2173_028061 [Erythroxylum novogranatense]|uniref:Fungal lipase-type domain-containing protein n=1 Tax=Erythroxylum novogranatense TaxID=1862640 RepID=A0AAV8U3S7_9ROSI|nr:hypothetical protein K2173_026932 [Erythroxylum novogranatense]KAJ8772884.1 hypothetical protein K2173_028061 [Erythroxylum novogranatense]